MQVNEGMEIFQALSELARRYQFRNRDEVCCYGLTVSQCYALQALHQKGPLASSELAMRLGLDLSSTTRLVDQLLRKKLASRKRSDEDGRVRTVEISEAGSRLVQRIETDFAELLENALREFPAAVRKAIPQVLYRLTAALQDASCEKVVIPPGAIQRLEH